MAKRIDVITPPPLEQSAGGRVNFGSPQQQWHGDNVMQLALFAGQEMMAIMMEKEAGFRLGYLGFNQHGFATMEQAKTAAPAFARGVLKELSDRVIQP